MAEKEKVSKKKKDTKIVSGVLHVQTSDNNTMINLVDENGNKILGG
jgi:ribosomal protein S11